MENGRSKSQFEIHNIFKVIAQGMERAAVGIQMEISQQQVLHSSLLYSIPNPIML